MTMGWGQTIKFNGMRKYLCAIFIAFSAMMPNASEAMAIGDMGLDDVEFRNAEADTANIMTVLNSTIARANDNSCISSIAKEYLGCPYRSGTIEGEKERLRVNTEEFDCMTLVETTIALALTKSEGKPSWRDFIGNLAKIRYRSGLPDGYGSRLHYFSDWIVMNSYKGIIEEVTGHFEGAKYEVKTLNFMSSNRDLYPSLNDVNEYERIKQAEIGFRSHRYPMIKTSQIAKAGKTFLKEGDIIAFTTAKKGLDVTHVGIITFINGTPRLIHASSKRGMVVIEETPLEKYALRLNASGIRVARLKL